VRAGTLTTFDLFLEGELGFAPVESGYAIREITFHIAHEEEVEILHGLARLVPEIPQAYPISQFPSKRSVRAQPTGVHTQSLSFLGGLEEKAWEQEVLRGGEKRCDRSTRSCM
jgi:hypothetical protein